MEVGLGPGDFVFDGDPAAPTQKKGTAPTQFLADVYYGQMAGWIKMPLGTEVNLGPGNVVFVAYRIVYSFNNQFDKTQAGCQVGSQLPPTKRRAQSPSFWPMSIVAKWLDG